MDPLTAVSLASAIVQLVDFSCKLVAESHEIYQSIEGASRANLDTESITKHINSLNIHVLSALRRNPEGEPSSESEITLRDLATDCRGVASNLLDLFNEFKVDEHVRGTRRKWETFRKAALTQSPKIKHKIKNLETQLDTMQKQMNRRLVTMMNDRQSSIFAMLDNLANHQMTELKEGILAQIKASSTTSKNMQAITSISTMLSHLTQLAYEQKSVEIVNSLDFPTRGERQSNVVEAYPHTFEWIFEECREGLDGPRNNEFPRSTEDNKRNHALRPQTSFLSWLRFGNDIYWISGKAGSGKSILMRYLVEDVRTKRELESWAGQAKVVTASCFFWGSGDTLQKSQQGLLQSLLHGVLSQCPDLVPVVCSSRCHVFGSNARLWTRRELLEVFEKLKKQAPSMMFCFFVDGLDELESNHKEIVRALEDMAKSTNFKICLSSRPLYVFLKAFGNGDQKLLLERLTKPDTYHYANQMLEADSDYTRLAAVDARCKEMMNEIVSNAQGVFLWVRLVVNELLLGLGSEDDIGNLQNRLRRLPNDLEDYYQLMLQRIDDFYREEAAELFQMTREAASPLSLIAIAFYRLEKIDSGFVFSETLHTEVDAKGSEKECLRLLSTRCQGFLVANGHTVSYLHRTVRDFLSTPKVEDLLKSWVSPSFSAERSLLKAVLAQMNLLASQEMGSWPSDDSEEKLLVEHIREFMSTLAV